MCDSVYTDLCVNNLNYLQGATENGSVISLPVRKHTWNLDKEQQDGEIRVEAGRYEGVKGWGPRSEEDDQTEGGKMTYSECVSSWLNHEVAAVAAQQSQANAQSRMSTAALQGERNHTRFSRGNYKWVGDR